MKIYEILIPKKIIFKLLLNKNILKHIKKHNYKKNTKI